MTQVSDCDVFSKYICTVCLDKVNTFHEFYRETYAVQQNVLRNLLHSVKRSSNAESMCLPAKNRMNKLVDNPNTSDIVVRLVSNDAAHIPIQYEAIYLGKNNEELFSADTVAEYGEDSYKITSKELEAIYRSEQNAMLYGDDTVRNLIDKREIGRNSVQVADSNSLKNVSDVEITAYNRNCRKRKRSKDSVHTASDVRIDPNFSFDYPFKFVRVVNTIGQIVQSL